jgi:ABC-type branched-subunit amino acid transport system ATPase component
MSDATVAAAETEPRPERGAPVLEARGLCAGYGTQPVVRDIDLTVHRGEIVALLGPNGAGKTTTLLALSGELRAMSGQILLNGKVTKAPLHRRARQGLAYVPEERAVLRSLSCRDNLRLGDGDPAAAVALFPELAERLDVPGGMLSGGEQQMLGLGRAISRQPVVLIVDELSLGLAPLAVRRLFSALREAADRGLGVLIVEQHVRQALAVAHHAHVLQRGTLQLSGPASELLANIDHIESSYLGMRLE